jgi:Uma2 family endonuclease
MREMTMTAQATLTKPVQTEITYEAFFQLPSIMQRYEIIDGEMIMTPAPEIGHQIAVGNLYHGVRPNIDVKGLGSIILAPADVLISRTPLRTRQPDLMFLDIRRPEVQALGNMNNLKIVEVAPDLVIEVLSGSDVRGALDDKLADYASIGVKEVWLVSREAATVEVLWLRESNYERTGLFGMGDTIVSNLYSEFNLPVAKIFE